MEVVTPEEDPEKRPHRVVGHFVSAVIATLMRFWSTSMFVLFLRIPPRYFLREEKPGGNDKKQELQPITNWGKDCLLFKISDKKLTAKKALIYRIDVSGHCVHVLELRRGDSTGMDVRAGSVQAPKPTVTSLRCRSYQNFTCQVHACQSLTHISFQCLCVPLTVNMPTGWRSVLLVLKWAGGLQGTPSTSLMREGAAPVNLGGLIPEDLWGVIPEMGLNP